MYDNAALFCKRQPEQRRRNHEDFLFHGDRKQPCCCKRVGGELIAIPQAGEKIYKDDAIGVVFPTYGCMVPGIVRRFLEGVKLEAEYIFAIATYGMGKGKVTQMAEAIAQSSGYHFDYVNAVLMLDNCQPQFDIAREKEKLPEKKVDEQIEKIIADIRTRKHQSLPASFMDGFGTWICQFLGMGKEAYEQKFPKNYSIDGSCIRCGTCAKVCPMGNITVEDTVRFSTHCTTCQACIHACPKHAIHFKGERNTERWRNPDVTLNEIITANCQL
ncbi:MAG: EFR1 family ferrodoxin [Clostridia bacterium]|nr:EFR1 family ferrodoxin [Clostridia bacterium]